MVQIFVLEKVFEGCDGLRVNQEMKVTIAAAACLLLLGFDDHYCFDRARTILVYPRPTVARNLRQSAGVVEEATWIAGMAAQGGAIILSWQDVVRDCRDRRHTNNVVLHEFAHHIDGLDGAMEGVPPLATEEQRQKWRRLAEDELKELRTATQLGQHTVLDPYGAQSLTELFAVATEAFYCDGFALAQRHDEMYSLLASLYRIDTRGWLEN